MLHALSLLALRCFCSAPPESHHEDFFCDQAVGLLLPYCKGKLIELGGLKFSVDVVREKSQKIRLAFLLEEGIFFSFSSRDQHHKHK